MGNRASHSLFAVVLNLLVLLLVLTPAEAARIEPHQSPEMGCDILVSGTITAGDAQALRRAISTSDLDIGKTLNAPLSTEPLIGMRPADRARVCFNSNGGSFVEGLEIAKLLIEYRKGSAVGENMACESACALAFMGGSTAVSSVEGSDSADRVLHPRGLLGFHAPSITVPNGQYDEATVAQAYGVALAALRALSETRHTVFRGYVPGTDQATYFRYQFPESLLLEMLGTPPDQMRYLRTVGEASRWDIRIGPIRLPEQAAPYARFASACDNVIRYWEEATEFSFETPPFLAGLNGTLAGFEVQTPDNISPYMGVGQSSPWRGERSKTGLRLIADTGEYWHECDVEIFSQEQTTADPFAPVGGVIFGGQRYFYAFQLFDPATEISTVAPQPGPSFTLDLLAASLSAEVTKTMAASVQSCWLSATDVRITNVTDYVNLRREPDFSARVIAQLPLNTQVRATRADNITVVGEDRSRQSCITACKAFGRNAEDQAARDRVQRCIQDNRIWSAITDDRGRQGWVSRKFLTEVK